MAFLKDPDSMDTGRFICIANNTLGTARKDFRIIIMVSQDLLDL